MANSTLTLFQVGLPPGDVKEQRRDQEKIAALVHPNRSRILSGQFKCACAAILPSWLNR